MNKPGILKLTLGLLALIVLIAISPTSQAQAYLNTSTDSHIFINEFQYGYTAVQTGDFVEIMGPARMSLNGWTLNAYSAQGALLETRALSGNFPNQTYQMLDVDRGMQVYTGGFGTLVFDYADLPTNGALALIRPDAGLSMFISWNGAVTATINGSTYTSTNVYTGSKENYRSIGLFGEGDSYTDFSWDKYAPVMQTRGITNNYQKMGSEVFFNELTYQDEDGANDSDKYERIEIAGPNGASLSNWNIVLYEGASGTVYKTIPFTEFEEGPQGQMVNGIRLWEKTWSSSMRNNIINSQGGLALVDGDGYVWQFISYLGSFTATNGPAAGITATDIGVQFEWNYIWWYRSLQVGGDGRVMTDFAWYPPANYTPLRTNQEQTFHPAGTVDTAPFVEVMSPLDKSINFPLDGNLVVDFNASVTTRPGWVTLVCERGGNFNLSITGPSSAYAYTLDPTVNLLGADRCTVTVKAANVYDTDARSYDYLTRDFVWTFTTFNQPPVANNQTIPAFEDTPVSIQLSASDPEGLPLSGYQLKVAPQHGTITGTPPNITYTPAPNYNGSDYFSYSVRDNLGVESNTAVVTINVTPVNDAPSFNVATSDSVLEDAAARSLANFVTAVVPGPTADEASQTVSFILTNNNNALFSVQPAIAANGTLTYTPAPNAFGTATVTVTAKDSGGTANGGVDTSAPKTFIINVTPVNDIPSFTKGADTTTNEDAGPQSFSGWATAISAGPANEADQTFTFHVTTDNPSLFSAGPSIDAAGNLTYTSASNMRGVANVTVILQDSGGQLNGGVDRTAAQTFKIDILPVNDAPYYTPGSDQNVDEDSGAQSVPGWATGINS